MKTDQISSKHCRAICDEVGIRLRQHLDRALSSPSQRILELLQELKLRELETPSPSLVPAVDHTTLKHSDASHLRRIGSEGQERRHQTRWKSPGWAWIWATVTPTNVI